MFKILLIFVFLLIPINVSSHIGHYEKINKIQMDILKDGKIIGFCNYEFLRDGSITEIKNETKFEVKLLGIKVFSIKSNSIEVYDKDKLISFRSKTLQNKKKKYVELNYSKQNKKYLINGSSFKGSSEITSIIGSWWNHKILSADKQISPLSGSVKNQIVKFIKKENIYIDGKNYLTHKFSLKSKDKNVPDDKKLDFEIWLEPKRNIIIKVAYNRVGYWEYKLKNIILN